ncbi:MAG: hypothetical protein K2L87_01450, partial [Clostridiales bacterium]|nr:hypothetical protein [Clostridiales bacterium]
NYKVGTGDNPYLFLVGDNKTLVRIEVNVKDEGTTLGGQLPYRAGGYEAELSVTEGALTAEDFEITYCDRDGNPLGGIPSELGEYAVHVNLKADKAADFYLQEMVFNYEIVAAVIDLSDLMWGYTDAESGEDTEYTEGFIYARKNGAAITHTVKLINVPEELAAFIEYDGTVEESKVGNYVAKFKVSSDFDSQHYEALVFPSAVGEVTNGAGELKWRIKALEIGRPMQGSIVFDGDGHDVVKLSGIALDDWAEYLNVTVKYVEPDSITGAGTEFAGTDAVNAGRYLVTFEFKSELLGGAMWDSGNTMQQTVSVTVEKLKLTMTGWDAKLPPNPMFTTEPESKYYKRIIWDMDGNEVDITAIKYNTTYRAEIRVAEEYGDNVEIEFAEGVENICEFTTDPDPNLDPPREIVKPTFEQDSLVYNGEDQTFVLKWTTAGDERYFEITGELTQKNAGDYEVRIRFIEGANARWSDGTASELVLSFSITKAIIAEEWNEYDRETNAYPTLKDARIAGLVTYEYFDLEGNPIAESDLENGTTYRVRARLTDEAYENYAFGEELLQESGEFEFETRSLSPFQSLSALLGLPVDFPLWQVVVTVISLILIIVFLILWIKYGKQKKEAKETIEQYEDLNGNPS